MEDVAAIPLDLSQLCRQVVEPEQKPAGGGEGERRRKASCWRERKFLEVQGHTALQE